MPHKVLNPHDGVFTQGYWHEHPICGYKGILREKSKVWRGVYQYKGKTGLPDASLQ